MSLKVDEGGTGVEEIHVGRGWRGGSEKRDRVTGECLRVEAALGGRSSGHGYGDRGITGVSGNRQLLRRLAMIGRGRGGRLLHGGRRRAPTATCKAERRYAGKKGNADSDLGDSRRLHLGDSFRPVLAGQGAN